MSIVLSPVNGTPTGNNPDFVRTLWRPAFVSHRPMLLVHQDW
jgi:hypothetical protein